MKWIHYGCFETKAGARQQIEAAEWFAPVAVYWEEEPVRSVVRPQLNAAINDAKVRQCGLVLTGLGAKRKAQPIQDTLVRRGTPLAIPEIKGWKNGEPLQRKNLTLFRGDYTILPEHAELGRQAQVEKAEEKAYEVAPEVEEAYSRAGTYAGAARNLNDWGVPTPSGVGVWHPQTVKRLLGRLTS